MKPPEGTGAVRHAREPVSPELVLVDLGIAAEARAALPRPDDTLARVELLVRASRIAASRVEAVAAAHAPSESARLSNLRASSPRRRRFAVVAGGAVAAVFVGALLVGVRVDLRGNPAGADTRAIGVPPIALTEPDTPELTTRSASGRKPASRRTPHPAVRARRIPRRFVWAPVAGASGYKVQFFRGPMLVFSAETPGAEITIPAKWTLAGRRQSLRPGDYEWYVWPLHAGLRSPTAAVQARLAIPRD